jgi:hypothetical protein
MKKIYFLLLATIILTSCWTSKDNITEVKKEEIQNQNYIVWWKENNYVNIYWNILNNETKTLTSNINGKVTYLSCDAWTKVNKNTIVARISPDTNSLSYQNNAVQINSLRGQLANLRQIRATTIANFDSKNIQLKLQESELENQLNTVNKTIWSDSEWIKNQLKIIEDSISLVEQNREASVKNIDDSILNLRKTAYNTIDSWIKRLDETFGITDKRRNDNDDFEDYLWAKNSSLKNELEWDIRIIITEFDSQNSNLSQYSDDILSSKLNEISIIFSKASEVVDQSVTSLWSLSQLKIDALYAEFLWISNWLVELKSKYDTALNSKKTTVLSFDSQLKNLEASRSQLQTQETSLNSNVETININSQNLKEQYTDLENTKTSTIKELDSNILSIEQAINQLGITFKEDVIYAWTNWTIKSKNVSKNNNVWIWTPICTIIPNNNSLKFELYSPIKLNIWDSFIYMKDWFNYWTWSILTESPVRNSITQNFTYEWNIDFNWFKEWDYLDVRVLSNIESKEIWIPIKYVFPMLDWYYVNKNINWDINKIKIEVWKMNNWEILIKKWLSIWDLLTQ